MREYDGIAWNINFFYFGESSINVIFAYSKLKWEKA